MSLSLILVPPLSHSVSAVGLLTEAEQIESILRAGHADVRTTLIMIYVRFI